MLNSVLPSSADRHDPSGSVREVLFDLDGVRFRAWFSRAYKEDRIVKERYPPKVPNGWDVSVHVRDSLDSGWMAWMVAHVVGLRALYLSVLPDPTHEPYVKRALGTAMRLHKTASVVRPSGGECCRSGRCRLCAKARNLRERKKPVVEDGEE